MATTDATSGSKVERKGPARTLLRSVLTQYWPFTVYVLMYAVVGMAFGSLIGTFDYVVAAALLAGLWFGLEGLHAVDLAHDDVAINLHAPTQRYVGYAQIALGSALGLYVALETTLLFLVLVPVAVVSGLAYNDEWFGGLFHDRDKATGLANFGLSWGFVPAIAGYLAISNTLTFGFALIAIGIAIDAAELNYLVGPSKMVRYEDMGIETDREYEPDEDVMSHRMHHSQKMQMVSWITIAAGAFLLLV